MNYTQNLRLPQWEGSDRIHHDDFNEAFGKIDEALAAAGNCHIATGSYVGTGESGAEHPNALRFDFVPQLVIVTNGTDGLKPGENNTHDWYRSFLWVRGQTTSDNYMVNMSAAIAFTEIEDGLQWYSTGGRTYQMNESEKTYYYFAIG